MRYRIPLLTPGWRLAWRGLFAFLALLGGLSGLAVGCALIIAPPQLGIDPSQLGERVWGLLIGVVLIPVGLRFLSVAWRLGAPLVRAPARTGFPVPKPAERFVLWLRPFAIDDRPDYYGNQPLWLQWSIVLESAMRPSVEEEIRGAVASVGPLMSIGSPQDPLPGASPGRVYASDASWKERVEGFMRRAELVVVAVGFSDHVLWEMRTAIDVREPGDVLLILPFFNLAEDRPELTTGLWQKFRSRAGRLWPLGLPSHAELGSARVMGFGPGWEPRPIVGPPRGGWSRLSLVTALRRDLDEALRRRGMPVRKSWFSRQYLWRW